MPLITSMKMPANTNKDANVHEDANENATKTPLKSLLYFTCLGYLGRHNTNRIVFLFVFESLLEKRNLLKEKTCFQNKSKFITDDHFAKCVNITIH